MAEREQHMPAEKIRAGLMPHIIRYVLGISLLCVIIVMLLVLWSN